MSTTIYNENRKQIRQAMEVEVELQVREETQLNYIFSAAAPARLHDGTLGNTTYSMRKLADLQDDGFPLDGEHQLYDSSVTPSADNGKIGARGYVGDYIELYVAGTDTITNLTIKSENVSEIRYNGNVIDATGLDILYIGASNVTLYIYPKDDISRIFIEYIVAGVLLAFTSENIIRCGLRLRSNLSPDNPTWEESDIEVQAYYPYDISDSLSYINDDWPIIYRAGYRDKSLDRRFYLSEPATMQNNILTLKGVDASGRMGSYTMREGHFSPRSIKPREFKQISFQNLMWGLHDALVESGAFGAPGSTFGGLINNGDLDGYFVRPEMSLKDCIQKAMNLTADLPARYRISYVDAGLPTFQTNEAFTHTWYINEEDMADIQRTVPRNISRIQNTNGTHKFDERLTTNNKPISANQEQVAQGVLTEYQFNSYIVSGDIYYLGAKTYQGKYIDWTPSRCVFVTDKAGSPILSTIPFKISGGYDVLTKNDGQPGVTMEMEPFIHGRLLTSTGYSLFSPRNLLSRNTRTTTFKFKGHPSWQPRDFLTITLLDGTRRKTRIASIELDHENGGTSARVTCQDTDLY